VKWLQTAWQLARDILLTGTGLWLIISQAGARDPQQLLIYAGLALLFPAVGEHVKNVWSGPSAPHGGGPTSSSPSARSASSSRSAPSPPPSPEGEADGGHGEG
jgi:hypothetical protein